MPKLRNLFLLVLIGAVVAATAYLVYNNFIRENLSSRQNMRPGSSTESYIAGTTSSESSADGTEKNGKQNEIKPSEADSGNTPGVNSSEDELHLIEPKAAANFELENLSGKKIKLSDYKGKPVVLSFWASWSPYCLEELPELQKLNDSLKESKKAVLLTVNSEEASDTVSDFIKSNNLTMPVLLDVNGAAAQSYGVQGLPFTLFIKGDGTVYGYIDKEVNSETAMGIIDMLK